MSKKPSSFLLNLPEHFKLFKMGISKILGIALLLIGLYVGYIGVNKLSNNTKQVSFLGIDIDASNENGQTKGILYIVGAVALCVGGVTFMRKSGSKA